MGGGTLHADHLVAQLRSTLNSNLPSSSSILNPSLSTESNSNTNNVLSFCCCRQNQLCRKMELVDGKQEKTASSCLYNRVFEPVPSHREVEDAVSALQEFVRALSSSGTLQQISESYDSRIVLSQGYQRLHDALQLLQTDPGVKKLVVSLSSDEAIWDAVMGNVLQHQRLLELPDSVKCKRPQISEQREFSIDILSWIFDIMKGKVLELIESFQSLMNDLFQSPRIENATSDLKQLDEKVRASTLLSIVILLMVIMARSRSH